MHDPPVRDAAREDDSDTVVVSIDMLDPSGASGCLLSVRLTTELGARGFAIPTAMTVANSAGLRRIEPTPNEVLAEQLPAIFSDYEVGAVVVGALPTIEIAGLVGEALTQSAGRVVWTPRFVARSGVPLVTQAVDHITAEISPVCDLIVPSLVELAVFGAPVATALELDAAAERFAKQFGCPVLATGGRLADQSVASDVVSSLANSRRFENRFLTPRQPAPVPVGLSTALATLLAVELAGNRPLETAIPNALADLSQRIRGAIRLGRHGSVLS